MRSLSSTRNTLGAGPPWASAGVLALTCSRVFDQSLAGFAGVAFPGSSQAVATDHAEHRPEDQCHDQRHGQASLNKRGEGLAPENHASGVSRAVSGYGRAPPGVRHARGARLLASLAGGYAPGRAVSWT